MTVAVPIAAEERMARSTRSMPQRTCIGCRQVRAPEHLTRLVRRPGGGIEVGRHLPGRGAWLCTGSAECFERAVKRRAFDRALRTTTSTADIEALRERLNGPSPSRPARMDGRGETTE